MTTLTCTWWKGDFLEFRDIEALTKSVESIPPPPFSSGGPGLYHRVEGGGRAVRSPNTKHLWSTVRPSTSKRKRAEETTDLDVLVPDVSKEVVDLEGGLSDTRVTIPRVSFH